VGEYEPLQLADLCNAGLESVETGRVPPIGAQEFHGIPFLVGTGSGPCFVLLEPGSDAVVVPIRRSSDHVIVAHRRIRQGPATDDPAPGTVVAQYTFRLDDGSTDVVAIRELMEISPAADEGWDGRGPFHAVGSTGRVLLDRYVGPWEDIGQRQTESVSPNLPDYFLFAWESPDPEAIVESVELVAERGKVLVAGITTAHAGEAPFGREAARTVRISAADVLHEPSVEVDRGAGSYVFRLPRDAATTSLDDPLKAWGGRDEQVDNPNAYVRIVAVPSATVAVTDGDRALGTFRWGDITHDEAVESDGLRVEVVERGRNWVHVSVLDDETGRPVPCRVHFRSPDGVPYQPYGHHDQVNSGLGTWHIDVGGDVRLGGLTYAYIDGTCQGWLPRGDVVVDVARGFEYEPLRQVVRIEPGERELVLRLKRWTSMNAQGWFSGDSHVHFLSTHGSLLEQRGEDLNVVNLLQSQWGSLFTNTEEFTGSPLVSDDGRHLTWVSQENRQPFFGHLALWGLSRPVMPWCTAGPSEAELGAWQETTLSDWADRTHEQGGTVVIAHFPQPNGEPPVLIATGRADAIEMIIQRPAFHAEYYSYLNAGYRLPLVGGTDKMSSDVPVGLYRTYAKLGDEPFSHEAWSRAVRAGRTFLSAGPILQLDVDGREPGDTVRISGGGTASASAVAESIFPMGSLEIVVNGEVVASAETSSNDRRLDLRADLKVEGDSWIVARCGGPNYYDGPVHRDTWRRPIFAHTSPVYVATDDREWSRFDADRLNTMAAMIDAGIERLRWGRHYPPERITHHHGEADHQAFLERPFLEARQRVRDRLERGA
jgi:hypothetical protein